MAHQRILLTGATGFVGPRLLEQLKKGVFADADYLVWDYRPHDTAPDPRTHIDIRSAAAVAASVAAFRPTLVVHLAAQSHVPTSYANPQLTWQINVMGSLNLFEALKQHAPQAGTLTISSSEVYGQSFKAGQPLDESARLQPLNPYAASKAAADIMAGQYAAQGLKIVRLRPFNHIGPGQREDFVLAAFAAQIARIEAGQQAPVIQVGNLAACRDFLDVNDVVNAYGLALENIDTLPAGLILNICSGTAHKISDLLNGLLAQTPCQIDIQADPARMRPLDLPHIAGNAAAARAALGWQARIPMADTLTGILDAWRGEINAGSKEGNL